jgi:hypothetical protein
MKRGIVWAILLSLVGVGGVWSAQAASFNSTNFSINGNIGDSMAGGQTSTNYQLTSAGGESIAGQSASSSYKLGQGYAAQLEKSLELTVSSGTFALGSLTPGTPVTSDVTVSVLTDAPGYGVAVQQDGPLTSGSNTITGISGSVGSPAAWSNGTTKGLGFTLLSASATPLDAKWGTGSAFAAYPSSATTIYSRTGFSGGATDNLVVRTKLDVTASQPTGNYANQVTWVGTMTP